MDSQDDKPLTAASKRPTRKRKQRITQNGQEGSRKSRKKDSFVQRKDRPSLTWLLPGAARAQRRPLPRPTKPPPPGITPQRRYREALHFLSVLMEALVSARAALMLRAQQSLMTFRGLADTYADLCVLGCLLFLLSPIFRIGVWRRVRDGGDTGTPVFVTLGGEIVAKVLQHSHSVSL